MAGQTVIPAKTNIPLIAKNQTLVKKPYLFKGYKFNGTTQYIDIPDNAILQPASKFTIEFRAKLVVPLASQGQAFLFFFTRTVGSSGYDMYMDRAANALVIQCFPGAGNSFTQYNNLSSNYTLTEWHHYAGQYDGSNMRLFIDGVNVSTTGTITANINYGTAQDLSIGAQISGGAIRFCNAYISDARFWSTARTTQQIYDNQFATINDPHAPGLIGYWRLDETSGTTALDFTPNANNGNIIATPPRQLYIFKELAETINLSAHAPKDVGFSVNPHTTPTIHLSAHAPAKTVFTQHPARALITMTARTPRLVLTQHATSTSIHLSAHAPTKQIMTQHPTAKAINITAHAPTKTIFIIHPTPSSIHLSAHAPAKQILTQHPTHATINITAHAPKAVSISKVYPTHATIHLSSNSVKTNVVIKPSHATIHLSVSAPSNRLTQHVSRCVVHLAIPPPKLNQVIYPTHATIHLITNSAMFVQSKVRPNPCTIHLTVPTSKIITVIVKFKFTVKMESSRSFRAILPDMD